MPTSLLALLDDIASVLDDVAVMTKIAAKKTSGVIGDDLALNTEQLSGASPDEELSIIYRVALGGFLNKAILIPLAILITIFAKVILTPLLMAGGLYLCYEGVEKVWHKVFSKSSEENSNKVILTKEEKIKGAIRTDFILSAEIIVIALASVAASDLLVQIISLIIIGVTMNIGIYSTVAVIIKIDDVGLYLFKFKNIIIKQVGLLLINATPYLMKVIGIIGTIAMFLVGGSIISHGLPFVGSVITTSLVSVSSTTLSNILSLLSDLIVGVTSGLIVLLAVRLIKRLKKNKI